MIRKILDDADARQDLREFLFGHSPPITVGEMREIISAGRCRGCGHLCVIHRAHSEHAFAEGAEACLVPECDCECAT